MSARRRGGGSGPAVAARVLHVLAPSAVGGLESVVRELAVAQHRAGHAVRVALTTDSSRLPLADALEEGGVPVARVRVAGRGYLPEWRQLAALVRSARPDVVHTHGYRSDVIGGSVARSLRVPVVGTVHGFTGGDWRNRVYETVQRLALRRCDAVVAVSRPIAERLADSGIARQRIHVVPNALAGTDAIERDAARDVLAVPHEGVRLGWIGRLSSEKGPDVMLRSIARLADLPVALSVLGDGREGPRLRALAASLGISSRVRWHGTVDGAWRLLRAFDAVVLSSRTEGTPMVLLEAMAAGVPVVATAVGGIPDVAPDGEALLAPPDDPEALAAAIRRLVLDPGVRSSLAASGRARVRRHYSTASWIERYDCVYGSVVRARAPES